MVAQAVRLSNIDIDNAIRNREFEVLFQPLFDLGNGALARVETFIRWRHQTLGLLPPGAFISFFEAQGRMSELTRHVLGASLDHYAKWRGAAAPGLSINLALSDLRDENFVPFFHELMREKQFPAALVTLECPMPPVAMGLDEATEQFARLAETGARLAIEVRGRANEFLRRVDPFPFAEIKTGGAAILRFARTVRGPGLSAISELLDLANDKNAAITAVGVEDQASLSALRSLGFSAAQGNHLGKVGRLEAVTPVQINDVRELLGLEILNRRDLASLFRMGGAISGAENQDAVDEPGKGASDHRALADGPQLSDRPSSEDKKRASHAFPAPEATGPDRRVCADGAEPAMAARAAELRRRIARSKRAKKAVAMAAQQRENPGSVDKLTAEASASDAKKAPPRSTSPRLQDPGRPAAPGASPQVHGLQDRLNDEFSGADEREAPDAALGIPPESAGACEASPAVDSARAMGGSAAGHREEDNRPDDERSEDPTEQDAADGAEKDDVLSPKCLPEDDIVFVDPAADGDTAREAASCEAPLARDKRPSDGGMPNDEDAPEPLKSPGGAADIISVDIFDDIPRPPASSDLVFADLNEQPAAAAKLGARAPVKAHLPVGPVRAFFAPVCFVGGDLLSKIEHQLAPDDIADDASAHGYDPADPAPYADAATPSDPEASTDSGPENERPETKAKTVGEVSGEGANAEKSEEETEEAGDRQPAFVSKAARSIPAQETPETRAADASRRRLPGPGPLDDFVDLDDKEPSKDALQFDDNDAAPVKTRSRNFLTRKYRWPANVWRAATRPRYFWPKSWRRAFRRRAEAKAAQARRG